MVTTIELQWAPLTVSPSSLSLSAGQTGTCTLSGGTGVYSAYSENTGVVTVGLNGSTVSVMGVSSGSATITYSDSGGNDSGTVTVTVYGDDATFCTTNIVYVDPSGTCGGIAPCYSTIQDAIDAESSFSIIKMASGNYEEDLICDGSYNFTLSGGRDSTFTIQSSDTIIDSLTISGSSGTVEVDNVVLQ
jgi:hypothetical protein